MSPNHGVVVTVICILSACSSEPALTDAVALACPTPGALPFRLASSGFQNPVSKTTASEEPRNKDQASDTFGNPGGAIANVYIADTDMPAAGAVDYHGVKARTQNDRGFFSTPLAGENVSLWHYDADAMAWSQLGRGVTDANGTYDLPDTGFTSQTADPVYAMLEADGSCAVHYDYFYPSATKVVVFDIDGTLTTDDSELYKEFDDPTYEPAMMTDANTMVQTWAMKGYVPVYLTARTHDMRAETRKWLGDMSFPLGPVITASSLADPASYKALWLDRMQQDFGWQVAATYGNADTDITAFADADIPLDITFIIGPLAGQSGTTAIANDDYTQHVTDFVDQQPDANGK